MSEALFNLQPNQLSNEIVELKPLEKQSLDALYSIASDPLIWEMHPSPNRYKKLEFEQFYEDAVVSRSAFLIYERATRELMGSTRFYDLNLQSRSVAIGYTFLARKFWGGVYNGAVKDLMLNYAFNYVDSVLFHIGAVNLRSQRAVQKLGAVKIREFVNESASNALYFEFLLTRKDWERNIKGNF